MGKIASEPSKPQVMTTRTRHVSTPLLKSFYPSLISSILRPVHSIFGILEEEMMGENIPISRVHHKGKLSYPRVFTKLATSANLLGKV